MTIAPETTPIPDTARTLLDGLEASRVEWLRGVLETG